MTLKSIEMHFKYPILRNLNKYSLTVKKRLNYASNGIREL